MKSSKQEHNTNVALNNNFLANGLVKPKDKKETTAKTTTSIYQSIAGKADNIKAIIEPRENHTATKSCVMDSITRVIIKALSQIQTI